jgi:hypothetical protein
LASIPFFCQHQLSRYHPVGPEFDGSCNWEPWWRATGRWQSNPSSLAPRASPRRRSTAPRAAVLDKRENTSNDTSRRQWRGSPRAFGDRLVGDSQQRRSKTVIACSPSHAASCARRTRREACTEGDEGPTASCRAGGGEPGEEPGTGVEVGRDALREDGDEKFARQADGRVRHRFRTYVY